jgi:hypothetical protein
VPFGAELLAVGGGLVERIEPGQVLDRDVLRILKS